MARSRSGRLVTSRWAVIRLVPLRSARTTTATFLMPSLASFIAVLALAVPVVPQGLIWFFIVIAGLALAVAERS